MGNNTDVPEVRVVIQRTTNATMVSIARKCARRRDKPATLIAANMPKGRTAITKVIPFSSLRRATHNQAIMNMAANGAKDMSVFRISH